MDYHGNGTATTTTGCGSGFECAYLDDVEGSSSRRDSYYFCNKTSSGDPTFPDQLPRYKLCSLPKEAFTQLHGLPVTFHNATDPQLAYLSTMGALDSANPTDLQHHLRVHTIVIMIHGSGRNVDDYLCTTNAALPPLQQVPTTSSMMVLAPWFVAPEDGPVTLHNKPHIEPLRWAEEGPIYHTWRYGADAMNLPFGAYAAVDALIERLTTDVVRFPALQRIVVAGHSAGGQYTQRWALLSRHGSRDVIRTADDETRSPRDVDIRTIVANPKSYCWLDARRYLDNEEYRVPDATTIAKCPEYNEWEWGLSEGNFLPTPYKDQAIHVAGGVAAIVKRYATRDVVYLAGELDVIPNGDCMERLQGHFRRVRSERFYKSLKEIYGHQIHRRLVVMGVHHDHALMFQSPEGYEALFGGTWVESGDHRTQ